MPPAGRRDRLIDQLADALLSEGLAAARLRPLARATGTSDRMLLYYFKDKDELIAAALQRVAERLAAALGQQLTPKARAFDELRDSLLALTVSDALQPYMRLWLEIAAVAARGDATFKAIGNAIADGFLRHIAASLIAPDGRSEGAARDILRAIEGEIVLKALGV